MKAWLLERFEGPAALRLADVAEPKPAAGEVRLTVRYAALNPADRYLSERLYPADPPLPHILGREAVGVVSAVGAGVERVAAGDVRMILRGEAGVTRWGTFAESVIVPADVLAEVPAGWEDTQAAGAGLVYPTAYQALTMWGELRFATVLVSGASGGVGVASVQLGKAMGHRVIALSRSAEKRRRLIALGAVAAFDPSDPQWRHRVKEYLSGVRVDLAIDNIGGTVLPGMIDTLGDRGRVSLVGRLAGPVPQFNTASLFFRRIRMGGVAVGAYTPQEMRRAWDHIVELLASINARPVVDRIFEFDQLPAAFERLAEGPMGKVLLRVS